MRNLLTYKQSASAFPLATALCVLGALGAGLLLAPLLAGHVRGERWPDLVLVLVTAAVLLKQPHTGAGLPRNAHMIGVAIATFCAAAGFVFAIDKLTFGAGAILLWLSIMLMIPKAPHPYLVLLVVLLLIPLPATLEADTAIALSAIETSLFVMIGQLLGFDVYQLGNQIIADGIAVSINSDCSGTMLFTPCFLGFMAAAAQKRMNQRSTLLYLAAALPFAFAVNCLRLTVLVIVNFTASDTTAAAVHDSLGWLFMSLSWLLPVLLFGSAPNKIARTYQHTGPAPSRENNVTFSSYALPTSLFVGVCALYGVATADNTDSALSVPYYVDHWVGEDQPVSDTEFTLLGTRQIIRRLYSNQQTGQEVLATFILHENLEKAREHSSATCFRALGWLVDNISQPKPGTAPQLIQMRVTSAAQSQHVSEINQQLAVQHLQAPVNLRLQLVSHTQHPAIEARAIIQKFVNAATVKRKGQS